MIYRVLYDGVDIHTNSVPDVLINPTVETEMNTAGSFTFTLPPDHFAWGDIYVFKGNVEVYENNDLIFFGRVANVDQNWNNERVVECEGALAFFNDSIQRPNSWTSNTLISQFLSDILDNHNAQVPDDRKIYLGNVTIDDMYVTRETNYEKTLDVLTRMCIDTNGGYFSLRKDENDGKIYLDWLKDLTDIAAQPVEFGLNLLDISRSLHAEDICTGVLARGGEVNDVKIDLHEVGEIDDPSIPVIHHTNQDPDILWHRDGLDGYGRVVQVKEFNDCTTVDGDNGLLAKATEWLIKQNTDIDTIEVDAAELGYFGESYPIFLLGQKVLVNSHPHHLENVELPMYKISMNLDSGTKRISIGTPPKRELTQISASNMGGGSGSGSSSGGGSGSGGVQDVRVNGTSVVQDGIARVNVPTDTVTESEMNTAISTAVSGKANQSDLESLATTVSGKANTSEVTAALALKADKTEIPEIEANPSDAATDTLNKIDIEGTVYQLAGGTQVEANPVEAATDDLETIKIGNTVYDISGGGSTTNYGKFTYDLLLKNDPLPPYQYAGNGVNRSYTLSKSIEDYDAVYVIVCTDYNSRQTLEGCTDRLILKNNYYDSSHVLSGSFTDGRLMYVTFTDGTTVSTSAWGNSGYCPVLYKVYGVKFENKLINRSDIYSEEERMIGRWTDGKPLYQKTIKWNSVPAGRNDNLAHNILNVDHIHITEWLFANSIVGHETSDQTYWAQIFFVNQTYVGYRFGPGWGSDLPLQITFQYTKTTDTPGSGVIPEDPMFISDPMIYSEEEQVVGSWTDGKPLYQKVADVSIPSGNLNTWVNHNISGLTNATIVDYSYDILFPSDPSIGRNGYAVGGYEIQVCRLTSTNFYIIAGSGWNTGNIKIRFIIRYTKTTDSILSGPKKGKIVQRSDIYSEEERLIGRWTDGKPLYQRTIKNIGITLQQNTWTNTGIPFSGVDHWEVIFNKSNSSSYDNQYPMLYRYYNGNFEAFCQYTMPLDELTLQYTKTTDAPFSKQLIEDPQFVMMSDIYSEDEQVVGRWTDGKPLYQKTVNVGTIIYDSSWHTVPHNIQNVDEIMVVNGYVESSGNTKYWFSAYRPGYSIGTVVGVSSQNVEYINNWLDTSENPKLVINVQYTKTTDIPGTGPTKGNLIYLPALYSEEEREVGVWTDGKPLYQKTFHFVESTEQTQKNYDISSIGAEYVKLVNSEFKYGSTGGSEWYTQPYWYDGNNNSEVSANVTTIFAFSRNWKFTELYATLQYTKTTDQPGSGTFLTDGTPSHHYSTSEKVVGTWIDGSTIYERTIEVTANVNSNDSAWTEVPYNNQLTNISRLINCYRNDATDTYLLERYTQQNGKLCIASKQSGVSLNSGSYLTLRYTKSS